MIFLSHRIDEFGVLKSIYLAIDEQGKEYVISLDEIINSKEIVITHSLNKLLNELRTIYKGVLPVLVDISQLKKLTVGKSKKMFAKPPWQFYQIADKAFGKSIWIKFYKILRSNAADVEIVPILTKISKVIKLLYTSFTKELKETNQIVRFENFENIIQQHLNKRQVEGIKINLDIYKGILLKLKADKDNMAYKLRKAYKITDISQKALREFLIENGHKISKSDVKFFNLFSYLKSASITCPLCRDLYRMLRIKSDYDNLAQCMPDEDDLIYPEFDCIGTITSRILVSAPHIQNLKRENRVIFEAKEGYMLLYCDYKQFEPGVLASLSKDTAMQDIYNNGDIYSEFSKFIFGSDMHRSEAKILFLAYLYGMSDKKLIKTINAIILEKGLKDNVSATEFFLKFKELESYKKEYSIQSLTDGFIHSEYSLRRNLKVYNGKTVKGEERFLLSQHVQGTASYIFKKAILACLIDPEIEFLIPMHDAALFQIPIKKEEEKKNYIETCFKDSYKEICPSINAQVEFKPFND